MTARQRRVGAVVGVLALVAVLAATIVSSVATASSGDTLDTLVIRKQQDWPSLDFMLDPRPVVWSVVSMAYDRLVSQAPNGKGYVPYLATSWKQTPKSITFKLRRDATCADGHVLTPIDVLNSFKRWIVTPKSSGTVASSSSGGWGPGGYHLRANMKKSTFTLSTDAAYGGYLGSFSNIGIICPAGLQALQTNPRALDNAMYGSGPYTLASAVHADQIVFKLRPEWHWGPPGTSTKTMPKTVIFKVIIDETTTANLLLTGGVDIGDVSGPDVDRLVASSSLTHTLQPNYTTHNLTFNMRQGRPFADPNGAKLREALMTAIDPRKWNVAALDGRGVPVTSVFRSDAECYDPKTARLYPKSSIEAAKQIMQSDGYSFVNGRAVKNGQPLKLTLVTSTLMNSGGEYLASVLQELGIDVTLSNLAGGPYGNAFLAGNFDVIVQRGTLTNPDPGLSLAAFIGPPSPVGANAGYVGGGDPALNRLVNASFQNRGTGSCKYFALVQETMLAKHYIFPMMAFNIDLFGRKDIDFPPYTPQATYPIYYVKVK